MGLMGMLRYPAFISNWSFNLVQLGVAGAERILTVLKEETELDENEDGYTCARCAARSSSITSASATATHPS